MNTDSTPSNSRLSRIETLWSVVRRAHVSEHDSAVPAQQQLLDIYGGAIKRYLLAAVRDAEIADELFQEFALKFVQGEFRSVDPTKGRFRAFVKTVLYRMVALHHRKKIRLKEKSLGDDPLSDSDIPEDTTAEDERFLISWREDLLARTWQALSDYEANTGTPYNTVLRVRVTEPDLNSDELAAKIGDLLGKPTTPGSARVLVHRSRDKFANLLIETIADSLDDPTREAIESELIELRLIDYCRDALDDTE